MSWCYKSVKEENIFDKKSRYEIRTVEGNL